MGAFCLAIFVGWPLLGTLVTADDDLPGGWSNLYPRPPWPTAPFWGQLSTGFAISAFVAALEFGLRTSVGDEVGIVALAAGALAFVLLRHGLH